jgi:hypothetical protein
MFFGALGNDEDEATSPYKNLVNIWKNELVPACDSEAIFFLRQVQFLKAEAMGVVLAVSFFGNARPTKPLQITAINA